MNEKPTNRKERRAFVRVSCEPGCVAKVKMIGQSLEKTCQIKRLSEDACDLIYEGDDSLIFNEQSILEVELSLPGEDGIFFFSRFIRYVDEHTFAIKVTEIESADFARLSRFLTKHQRAQGA